MGPHDCQSPFRDDIIPPQRARPFPPLIGASETREHKHHSQHRAHPEDVEIGEGCRLLLSNRFKRLHGELIRLGRISRVGTEKMGGLR